MDGVERDGGLGGDEWGEGGWEDRKKIRRVVGVERNIWLKGRCEGEMRGMRG